MSILEKYKHIDFVPPKEVASAAIKGLEYRQKAGGKGGLSAQQAAKEGIGSGVQRAVNLKNRDKISPYTIKRMFSFFSRHEKNKSIDPKHKDEPWKDRGYVSWLIWGGDPGFTWVKKVKKQMDTADKSSIKKSGMALKVAHMYLSASSQIQKGIDVEKEHKDLYELFCKFFKKLGIKMPITKEEFYKTIAKAHLKELPDYYDRLDKMEKGIEKTAMDFSTIAPTLTPEKKLDPREITRVIRQSIAAELDAIHLYEIIVDSTDDSKVKKVLQDIADEEKVHVGELEELLKKYDKDVIKFNDEGAKEVKELEV